MKIHNKKCLIWKNSQGRLRPYCQFTANNKNNPGLDMDLREGVSRNKIGVNNSLELDHDSHEGGGDKYSGRK